MNWDDINLSLLGFFGAAGLGLTLLIQLLKQLPELIAAIRKTVDAVRRREPAEPRDPAAPQPEEPAGPEADEPAEPGSHE
ncbi:hypothetical protein [Streptomyces chattanoogensis]|uniref:hypothetical protein n=1 Tax=Streptomyces chattanoogensis TaxID=66876 RepID=UPI003699EA93